MRIEIENPSATEYRFSLLIPADSIDKTIDETIKSYGKNLTLDGFRKGKVPTKVIEERFAKEIIKNATTRVIDEETRKALSEKKLIPITDLSYKIDDPKQVSRGNDFAFAFAFEALAPVELPENLEEISIDVVEPMVLPGEIHSILEKIQRQFASLEEIDTSENPQEGNVVRVDIHASYENEDIAGLCGNNIHIQLKENSSLPEVDALLRTMKKGEEATTSLHIAKTYPDPKFQDKTAEIVVRLHAVNKEVLPEINDELATKAGFDSYEKMQKQLFFDTMNNKMLANKADAQNTLLEKLLDAQEFPVPQSLIKRSYTTFMDEQQDDLKQKGLDDESIRTALKEMREKAIEDATKRAKSQAFLMALAQKEGIVATDKSVANFIKQMAKENNQDPQQLYEHIWRSNMLTDLKNQIVAMNALEFLYSKVKKITVDINGKPVDLSKHTLPTNSSYEDEE